MGWQRRILRVDLTAGTSTVEPLNMEWANAYLGERGLATKYLMETMDPSVDALSPENVLIFATGPAHRHHGLDQRALRGGHQGSAHRRHRLLELGRQVRGGAQVRGLRPAHRARPLPEARVPAHRRRRGRDRGRGAGLGHELLEHRGMAEGPPPGPAAQGRLDRDRGREPGALRVRRERSAPRRGPLRGRRGHGLEAAQGDRGARHEGSDRRRSEALHVGRRADQGQALGRPGAAAASRSTAPTR